MATTTRDRTDTPERSDRDGGKHPLRAFVHEYHWVHTGLGLVGNTAFLVGSVLFFWESTKVAGIWLFVVGATGMLIGSVGQAIVQGERRRFDGS